ncbi:hypothetical protein HPB50_021726 [Hyalomma asiaticum]|uniref:Uncharacterized protein n=1 Tax=Hyalomma asiaticum TaxID=266040 RepID=A0ACB7S2T4_HYAAI|nr:hypothetical protein HPB50_021726 [Hyalomma asiaticum]
MHDGEPVSKNVHLEDDKDDDKTSTYEEPMMKTWVKTHPLQWSLRRKKEARASQLCFAQQGTVLPSGK